MKRILVLFIAYSLLETSVGQITDDFEDGNFADGNPLTWTVSQVSGDDDFIITSGEVQSDGPSGASGDLYLSTNLGIDFSNNDVVWTFKARYTVSGPSGSNRIEIYLVSDIEDITGSPQGYYIGMGESGSGDGIDFFKTTSGTALIEDANDFVGSGINIHVRVTRTMAGLWTLEADPAGGDTFQTIGAITDTEFSTGNFFGFYVQHTSSRFDEFYFDDFTLTLTPVADTNPPILQSAIAISNTQVDVTFNESVDEATAETIGNYVIDSGINVTGAMREDTDNSIVHLTTNSMTNGQSYTITINNVEDESSNAIATNSQGNYQYLVFAEATQFDVVINEFMADPNPVVGLPDAEYVELFNRSGNFLNLENWQLDGQSLESYQLNSGAYVIICEDDDLALFSSFSNVITITTLTLSNSAPDNIVLNDDNTLEIHSIIFEGSSGGISTELINPNGPDYSKNNYTLSTDVNGGTPGGKNSVFDDTLDTTLPTISEILVVSSTELDLVFSEPVDEITSENNVNYTVDGGVTVSSVVRDDDDNATVRLLVSTLVSAETRTLTVNNVEDLSGNVLVANSTIDFEYIETVAVEEGDVVINEFLADPVGSSDDFVELYNRSNKFFNLSGWKLSDESSTSAGFSNFILRPWSYVIIFDEDASMDYASFGDAIPIPSLTLNNSDDQIEIIDNSNNRIAFLVYTDQPDEGISSELVNPDNPCISSLSYSASIDNTGGTPGQQNSIFDDSPDMVSPTVTSSNFDAVLTINFSETMDESSLLSGTYEVSGLTISSVNTSQFPTSVEIDFVETINSGLIYNITVSNVSDCWGNVLDESTINFGLGRNPDFNEILITEIQFDQDPSVGLPDVEFIEIYNNTSDLISTEEIRYSDATSSIALPAITLGPMEYYVLTSTSGASEFSGVNVVGVSGFPSLSNSGEQLILSRNEDLIFSIDYNPDWHDEDKKDGGYTLEMKDISNPCVEEFNWGSSTNKNGGTPGLENSLVESIPDNFGPQVIKIVAISKDSVRIDFDEKIDPSAEAVGSIVFSPSLNVASLNFNYLTPRSLFVILNENLVESNPHSISLSNVTDCNGNVAQDSELTFALPSVAGNTEILLSEILFNPRTNGVDFIELYNNSELYISLRNWQLARITDSGISDEKEISENELVIGPGGFFAISTSSETLFTNYPQGARENFVDIDALPTYANDSGNVVLVNVEGIVQQLFHYEDDFHYSLLESTDGVSLERISYQGEGNDQNNWRSASSIVGFATPGYGNSQSLELAAPSGKVEANPKVFIPGNSGSGRDFTTINYQFEQPGKFANITIYDQTGRLVKNIAEGALLSTSGFVRWDGTNNAGKLARLGYYVILFEVYDSTGNSEILKETVVVGRDF